MFACSISVNKINVFCFSLNLKDFGIQKLLTELCESRIIGLGTDFQKFGFNKQAPGLAVFDEFILVSPGINHSCVSFLNLSHVLLFELQDKLLTSPEY